MVTEQHHSILHYITFKTKAHNVDNISRTKAYQNFYFRFPEIRWSLVAAIVSRNAGWNMTDLYLPPFRGLLGIKERELLFTTYERANWLIFSDAFPQLLMYQLSRKYNRPLFHLLTKFHVSRFMVMEWNHFWKSNDKARLLNALIINEQNLIQHPTIEQQFFDKKVFKAFPYRLQNHLFMNAVLLPDCFGHLHGTYVHNFTKIDRRIDVGQKIAAMLEFPNIQEGILDFIVSVEPTGSRREYEQFLNLNLPGAPFLRAVYPIIAHRDIIRNDWYKRGGVKRKWQQSQGLPSNLEIGKSFYLKRKLLYTYFHLKQLIKKDLYH
ncbi:DUF2515 family protein [Oceanobacillus massiliensis]|uniref:DUF2515 family protein n=2 Tax=Oceanobacillus massiliensis TaxID=1465765 RepID=UPI000289296D|nr:DUF2515 family protein [Oceanobacillus massiliensis]